MVIVPSIPFGVGLKLTLTLASEPSRSSIPCHWPASGVWATWGVAAKKTQNRAAAIRFNFLEIVVFLSQQSPKILNRKKHNGGVDAAAALPSSFAGSRLMRKSLPVAPVQRFVRRSPTGAHFTEVITKAIGSESA